MSTQFRNKVTELKVDSPGTAIICQIFQSVVHQNLNNDDCIEAKSNGFSPVIESKIIKIHNKECYPKENEKEINNSLGKLIHKMNTTFCSYKSSVIGSKQVDYAEKCFQVNCKKKTKT